MPAPTRSLNAPDEATAAQLILRPLLRLSDSPYSGQPGDCDPSASIDSQSRTGPTDVHDHSNGADVGQVMVCDRRHTIVTRGARGQNGGHCNGSGGNSCGISQLLQSGEPNRAVNGGSHAGASNGELQGGSGIGLHCADGKGEVRSGLGGGVSQLKRLRIQLPDRTPLTMSDCIVVATASQLTSLQLSGHANEEAIHQVHFCSCCRIQTGP